MMGINECEGGWDVDINNAELTVTDNSFVEVAGSSCSVGFRTQAFPSFNYVL